MEILKTALRMEPGDWELGMLDGDGEDPTMLCCLVADGDTPEEFFGRAGVEGTTHKDGVWRDWLLSEKRCPFREEAIELAMAFWRQHCGPIARFEVDAILERKDEPVTFKTARDAGLYGIQPQTWSSPRVCLGCLKPIPAERQLCGCLE